MKTGRGDWYPNRPGSLAPTGGSPGDLGSHCEASKASGYTMESEKPQRSGEAGDVTFSGLVLMFGTTALVHLGAAPDPVSGQTKADLPQAKQVIDLLDVLKEKTVGNLTADESSMLDALLFDLRMRFLEAMKGR